VKKDDLHATTAGVFTVSLDCLTNSLIG